MRVSSLLLAVFVAVGCTGPSPSGAQTPAPPAPASPEVLAVVNGSPITDADLRKAAGLELARVEEQLYQLRKDQLEGLIALRLFEAEAKRRGITPQQLEETEVVAKAGVVSEPEVDAFIEANRARIRGDVTQLRPQVRDYLQAQKREQRRTAVIEGLRTAATIDVRLAAPAPFRAEVDIAGAPVRGDAAAPVTIIEYSDFHCPFCRRVQPTLAALLDRYKGKVRLVYKHLPLDQLHPNARRVSEASYCAGKQEKFWAFHDAVYADTSSDATEATLTRYAATAGLDAAAFSACLAAPEAREAVARDLAQGEALGLSSTPGFFVNGREVRGAQPIEAFTAIIDEELRGARR
jgi:protein-disulfide isomerase